MRSQARAASTPLRPTVSLAAGYAPSCGSSGEAPGFPRFKPAARWHQLQFPHGGRALRFDPEQRRVSVPGVGAVRLRKGRTVPEEFGRAWIVERNGR